ncbi:hypothetical protein WN51_01808 [Melipona quadrifasciata]|uniref:Uncharacterized protein n=1 Tax=Melipona quadrifasciata TaxID=166423 RepID=A0A0M8ZWL7_9HYME|nr:hypothetical protein WN51_01808 [Melipona quadrifasciata]
MVKHLLSITKLLDERRYCRKTNLYKLIAFCHLTSIVTFATETSVRQAIKGTLRMYVGQQDTYDCKWSVLISEHRTQSDKCQKGETR